MAEKPTDPGSDAYFAENAKDELRKQRAIEALAKHEAKARQGIEKAGIKRRKGAVKLRPEFKATYEGCIEAIRQAASAASAGTEAGEAAGITKQRAAQILEAVDATINKNRQKKSTTAANEQTLILDEMDRVMVAHKDAAKADKRNALINQKIYNDFMEFKKNFKSGSEAILAYMGGVVTKRTGGRRSVDNQEKALKNAILGKFVNTLEKENLLNIYKSGKFDDDIAAEYWALGKNEGKATRNVEAQKIARIIKAIDNELLTRLNRAGSFKRAVAGDLLRDSHNMYEVRRAGKEAWIDFVRPLVSKESFGMLDENEFLSEAFHRVSIGEIYEAPGISDAGDAAKDFVGFKGPGNLAKMISASRFIIWKDAASWKKYHDRFGTGSVREAIQWSIEGHVKSIALLENFGPNPKAMFDRIMKTLRDEAIDDPDEYEALRSRLIPNLFAHLDGSAAIPANRGLARFGSITRMGMRMAYLGFSTIASFSDLHSQVSVLKRNGVPVLESYGNAFRNILRGRGNAEQKEIARLIGAGIDGVLSSVTSRFEANDSIPGTVSKLQQKFFALNLMNWWTDAHQSGVANLLSQHIGASYDLPFSKLNKKLLARFNAFGLGERDWNLFRKTAWQDASGNWVLTPDRIRDLPDVEIAKAYGIHGAGISEEGLKKGTIWSAADLRQFRKIRDSLETTWRAYFHDQIYSAVPFTEARTASLLTFGTRRGTPEGEAVNFLMLFKSFPFTFLRRVVAPMIYDHGEGADTLKQALFGGRADYLGLAHLIAATTILGYMSNIVYDFLSNKTQRDPRNIDTWTAAMMRGGALGLYGDLIFGEFNKYGHSITSTLGGPALGAIEDFGRIYSSWTGGDLALSQMLSLALRNAPFANLFYTKAGLDFLIVHALQETVNPGYMQRMERALRQRTGQQFLVPPRTFTSRGGFNQYF